MPKIIFLGTLSGTEPYPDMHHSAFVIESGGYLYWFDAGENCSRTAHLMGLDLLKVKSIFISHTHMDHIGGLGNLLWNMRKICNVKNTNITDGHLSLSISNLRSWDGIFQMLKCTEGGFECPFELSVEKCRDGEIFADENISVRAVSNSHLQCDDNGEPLSYSFVIHTSNQKIVYSGDLGEISGLDGLIADGCDILICETGHWSISEVCRYVEDKNVGQLLLTHNGRSIIDFYEEAQNIAKNCKCKTLICYDKMIFDI